MNKEGNDVKIYVSKYMASRRSRGMSLGNFCILDFQIASGSFSGTRE